MKIDGGCHCGAITYEAEIDPRQVGICHCTDCQTLTGTAFRVTVWCPRPTLRSEGQAGRSMSRPAKAATSARRPSAALRVAIYATSVGDGPKVYGLRIGTVRQRQELVPKRQVWRRSALTWVPPWAFRDPSG